MKSVKITFLNGETLILNPDDTITSQKTVYHEETNSFEFKKIYDEETVSELNYHLFHILEGCDSFCVNGVVAWDKTYKTSSIFTIEKID